MSSSLFGLISLAGSASLGELRARGSNDTVTLAREIVDMVRLGTIQLSPNPDYSPSTETQMKLNGVFDEANHLRGTGGSAAQEGSVSALVAKLETVMDSDEAAQSIIVDPTSRGFRLSL